MVNVFSKSGGGLFHNRFINTQGVALNFYFCNTVGRILSFEKGEKQW